MKLASIMLPGLNFLISFIHNYIPMYISTSTGIIFDHIYIYIYICNVLSQLKIVLLLIEQKYSLFISCLKKEINSHSKT